MQEEITGNVPLEVYTYINGQIDAAVKSDPAITAVMIPVHHADVHRAESGFTWRESHRSPSNPVGDLVEAYIDACVSRGIDADVAFKRDLQIICALERGGQEKLNELFLGQLRGARHSLSEDPSPFWGWLRRVLHVCPTLAMAVRFHLHNGCSFTMPLPIDASEAESSREDFGRLVDMQFSVKDLELLSPADWPFADMDSWERRSAVNWYLHFRGFRTAIRDEMHVKVCRDLFRVERHGDAFTIIQGYFLVGQELYSLAHPLSGPDYQDSAEDLPYAFFRSKVMLEGNPWLARHESEDIIKRLCVVPKRE